MLHTSFGLFWLTARSQRTLRRWAGNLVWVVDIAGLPDTGIHRTPAGQHGRRHALYQDPGPAGTGFPGGALKELPRSVYLSVLYDTRNDRCLIFLAIEGGGRWSVDRLWSDSRNE